MSEMTTTTPTRYCPECHTDTPECRCGGVNKAHTPAHCSECGAWHRGAK